jgi:biopolymer transport protein ExbB/TolQ
VSDQHGGQATIDKVAGPVGEALIMTALGLAVAIPATFGYNALVRGNKFVLTKLNASPTTCTPTSSPARACRAAASRSWFR